MKKFVLILIGIIVILLFFYKAFDIENFILRKMYPQRYSEYVYLYSAKYNVDPLIVFSIIKVESNFNEKATSHTEAIGLMQLMESTATEMYNKISMEKDYHKEAENFSKEIVYEPQKNIQLGVKYFSTLLEKYNNNLGVSLAAYNAGMGNVDEWINKGIINKNGSNLENIPYKETNNYVRRILNSYEIYKSLYEYSQLNT